MAPSQQPKEYVVRADHHYNLAAVAFQHRIRDREQYQFLTFRGFTRLKQTESLDDLQRRITASNGLRVTNAEKQPADPKMRGMLVGFRPINAGAWDKMDANPTMINQAVKFSKESKVLEDTNNAVKVVVAALDREVKTFALVNPGEGAAEGLYEAVPVAMEQARKEETRRLMKAALPEDETSKNNIAWKRFHSAGVQTPSKTTTQYDVPNGQAMDARTTKRLQRERLRHGEQ
ncbi:hypothetical protein KVT40_000476 [Elsinoe batatas]|uniref:Uncharacterized protein n=1 Tax=Elsinoe batatas TaxID=2601811 RepID=A0A8K0PIN7_9PEZI|nr:hypothetical protein KVT40_000476 [Elsinoe batatas]